MSFSESRPLQAATHAIRIAVSAALIYLAVFVGAYVAYAAVVVGLKIVGGFVHSVQWLGPTGVVVLTMVLLFKIPAMRRGVR